MIKQTLALAILTLSVSANAATVFGTDVKFTYDDTTLFGSALTVGNSIFFQPTDFRAESTNGTPSAISVSDLLNITAEVITDGYLMTDFVLFEAGDYELSAGDTSVTASARLQVASSTTLCGLFTCFDSDAVDATDLDTVGAITEWDLAANVDLADTAGWGSDTEVTVQWQNNLSATTFNEGERAWIQKKIGGIGMEVVVVPVPAAAWLFGSALLGLGALKRKKV